MDGPPDLIGNGPHIMQAPIAFAIRRHDYRRNSFPGKDIFCAIIYGREEPDLHNTDSISIN